MNHNEMQHFIDKNKITMKKCPFCNGNPKIVETCTRIYVKCKKCGASSRGTVLCEYSLRLKRAIDNWNNRTA